MLALLGITRQITKGDILRYVLLPQVFPRVRDLYKSGFSNLAYLIAQVYRGVRILQATDAGELLPRIAASADFFECRFCPWAARCWSLTH